MEARVREDMQPDDRVKVTLTGPGEPSGLATMLAQYFEQNIRDFSRKSDQARRIRGKLAVEAVEGDVAITIHFTGDEIEISEGADADADMLICGGIFSITELATGAAGAAKKKILGGDLKVRSAWKHPVFALRAAGFMSLPAEMRAEGADAKTLKWKLVAAACGAAALGAAVYFCVR